MDAHWDICRNVPGLCSLCQPDRHCPSSELQEYSSSPREWAAEHRKSFCRHSPWLHTNLWETYAKQVTYSRSIYSTQAFCNTLKDYGSLEVLLACPQADAGCQSWPWEHPAGMLKRLRRHQTSGQTSWEWLLLIDMPLAHRLATQAAVCWLPLETESWSLLCQKFVSYQLWSHESRNINRYSRSFQHGTSSHTFSFNHADRNRANRQPITHSSNTISATDMPMCGELNWFENGLARQVAQVHGPEAHVISNSRKLPFGTSQSKMGWRNYLDSHIYRSGNDAPCSLCITVAFELLRSLTRCCCKLTRAAPACTCAAGCVLKLWFDCRPDISIYKCVRSVRETACTVYANSC